MNILKKIPFYGRILLLFPVLVADSKIKGLKDRCRELEKDRLSFLEQIVSEVEEPFKDQAGEYLRGIADRLDPIFYRRWKGAVTRYYIKPHFENIFVEGTENLSQREDEILVIVSRHFSLDDFMIQGTTLYNNNIEPPVFSAGANLLGTVLRDVLKGWGAASIERDKKRDRLYLEMVKLYFTHALASGRNAVIYPEEGRSRNGKMRPLKSGLLNSVIDAFSVSSNKRYKIIPAAVSYERIREDSVMIRTGTSGKRKGIIRRALDLYDLHKYLGAECGNAYVRFGEPFYLNDLAVAEKDGRALLPILRKELQERLKKAVKIPISAMIAYSKREGIDFRTVVRTLDGKADIDHPLLRIRPGYIQSQYLKKPYVKRMLKDERLINFYANLVEDVL